MDGTQEGGGRRVGLDVVRNAAITLVLLQHVLVPSSPMGRTGVSLFFALSGYLITGLLVSEFDRSGGLQLRRFYLRRFARLMPALLLMVGTCTIFLSAVGKSVAVWQVVPALTYTENVAEILTGRSDHYFGHTWSLAVEENFYLVWPLALLLLWRGFVPRGVLTTVLAVCGADLVLRVVLLVTVRPSETFFYEASPMRIDALMLGCAACLAIRMGWQPRVRSGLVGLAILLLQLEGPDVLRGAVLMSTVVGTGSALVVAACDRVLHAPAQSLTARVLRWGADLSYPLYLWHFPLIVIAVMAAHHDDFAVRLGGLAPAGMCAYLSLRFVERPVLARLVGRTLTVPAARVAA